ncbi:hypothetical protein B9Z55_022849 [Caenorhabditis nigoni]|uniref:CCHC-type domain-containing protein n=1 Tax=Caenorhabditis nigoni TaxID=1611254 RepID=A0A2G5SM02_9PELO|nr:hypothetical protein B9Z55_022849 [Caenorhabditis nigoni]
MSGVNLNEEIQEIVEKIQSGSGVTSVSWKRWSEEMDVLSPKDRSLLVKGFTKFVESSVQVENDLYEAIKMTCKGTDRQWDVLMAPVRKFGKELRERYEELGGEGWQLEVIRVMRESNVETVEKLRELCESATEMVPGGGDEDMALLRSAWEAEKETVYKEIKKRMDEKQLADLACLKLKKALKTEKEANAELRARLEDQKLLMGRRQIAGGGRRSMRTSERADTLDELSGSERGWLEDYESVGGMSCARSTENEVMKEMVAAMGKMMKATALPEPKTFDGTGDFKEFKRAFLLKYQQVTDEDDELVAILEEKFLKGPAKSLFKALPDRHARPIVELFVEFERKLRKRQVDAKAEALHEFDRMQRAPDEKLWEYLVRVEKWSRKVYPEVSRATLSQMRTTKLLRATEDDDMLQSVLVAKRLELSLKDQYDHLKDIVLQTENEKLRKQKEKGSDRKGRGERGESRASDSGSDSSDDKEAEGLRRGRDGEVKCFTCGGVGHFARQCVSKRVDHVKVLMNGFSQNVGKRAVETVGMLGQRRRVVIDSGAVVSLISTRAYERLKAGCRDWRKEVEVLGDPNFSLLNASRSVMRARGQLKIPIVVRGRRVGVIFQLVENNEEVLLIGTNAFGSIGVELKWKVDNAVSAKKRKVPAKSAAKNSSCGAYGFGSRGTRADAQCHQVREMPKDRRRRDWSQNASFGALEDDWSSRDVVKSGASGSRIGEDFQGEEQRRQETRFGIKRETKWTVAQWQRIRIKRTCAADEEGKVAPFVSLTHGA